MLTELDHGLDAKNLETTATLQPDGGFVLNTPRPEAAKYETTLTDLSKQDSLGKLNLEQIYASGCTSSWNSTHWSGYN